MKILQVVTMFPPAVAYGGPSVIAAQQASALVKRGHQVTVATSNVLALKPLEFIRNRNTKLNGVDVEYFRSRVLRPHFSFIVSRDFSEWLRRHVGDFDVVHVHFGRHWMTVRAAQIAIGDRIPTFLQTHGMLGRVNGVRGLMDRLWVERILEESAGVFSYGQDENGEIRRITPAARLLELPNGVPLPAHAEAWTVANLSDPKVLFLARLHPRKRVLAFVEMARTLESRGVPARYRIVGPDEGDLTKAQRLVREYNLQDRVSFVGSLRGQAVAREYIGSSVYVLPSANEPWGMTVLEALSLGVPTVVTSTSAIAPMLQKNNAALVSPPEPERLADAVARILYEPALAENLSIEGRRLIKEELTVDRVAELLENYYGGASA
jgi:glycosyltransferase involved in cell wall biosynthesis